VEIVDLQALLAEVVRRYRESLGGGLVALALYGSRARGDARPKSDVDLFLLAEELPETGGPRATLVTRPLAGLPQEPWLSVTALTPGEFEQRVIAMDLDLALDARVLHDPRGYLAGKLARLRQLIEEATLERSADLVWRWRVPPTRRDWRVDWEGVVR
jgi:hypothetical protein